MDGDTLVIEPANGGQNFICRLYGIDAPEKRKHKGQYQPYGKEARLLLEELVAGQFVNIEITGAKTYGREVCVINLEGININLLMVHRGMAWAYRKYLKRAHLDEYVRAENTARRHKLGLWQGVDPMPPWKFRNR